MVNEPRSSGFTGLTKVDIDSLLFCGNRLCDCTSESKMICNMKFFLILILSWRTNSFQGLEKKTVTISGSSVSDTSVNFEVSYPVSNPIIPYTNKIPVEMKEDMALFFQGSVPEGARRFSIDLKTGPSSGDDIVFHFNPRIGQYTVLDSLQNGEWGPDKCASVKPFTPGSSFYMIFVIRSNYYEVYVNGQNHSTFNHRIPFNKVSTISIKEDVSFNTIGFLESWSKSPLGSLQKETDNFDKCIDFEVSYPVINPTLPFLPLELQIGSILFFNGSVPTNAKRFSINLKTGPFSTADIALHFNPRIGQNTVLNSFQNGKWGPEEFASVKPFTPGSSFYMIVVIKSNYYEVYVNHRKHSTFNHRIPFTKVSTILFEEDISFNSIDVI